MTLLPNCCLKERGPGQKKENQFQALVQTAVKKALKSAPPIGTQGPEERREKDLSGKMRAGCQVTGKNILKNIMQNIEKISCRTRGD